jgi:hypothetical protein
MKNLTLYLLIPAFLVFFQQTVIAQTEESPVSYMNTIFTAMEKPKLDTWQYLKAVTRGKGALSIDNKRQDLLNEIKKAKYDVGKIGRYKGDDTLKNAVIEYLDMSYTVLKEEYDKILNMEEIAEQSYDLMEAYLLAKEKANEKLNESYDKVIFAQQAFAGKYNITLVNGEIDKTSEKIIKAGKALKYYNELYLIFFKSYKQEAYVLDAMERNDISAFEQNTNTLALYTNESLEKLTTLEAYLGDPNLKSNLKKALTFYKYEAENDFPSMTDYFIKKDNFEKIKKSFESINENKRTQQDIDSFNNAVNEFNAAAQKANQISKAGNSKREKMLNEWNMAVDNFFSKYSD